MLFKPSDTEAPYHQNLKLIAAARVAIWCMAQCFLLVDYLYLDLAFNFVVVQGILGLLALSAVFTYLYLIPKAVVSEQTIKLQLVSDALIMTWLFHVTGGAANPFVSLLLFPLMISASILSARFSWFMVFLTVTCFGSLYFDEFMMLNNAESPSNGTHHHHMHHSMGPNEGNMTNSFDKNAFSLHIIGMWFNFAISAILISIFVVRMRQEIDKQRARLNAQREQSLRDEQLLGIATQAASAAHHMSTPLATMSVLVEDLLIDSKTDEFKDDLKLLSQQLGNCKNELDRLRNQAQHHGEVEVVSEFIAQLADEFNLLRPKTLLETQEGHDLQAYKIKPDPSLRMAVLNILNNAADASPDKILLDSKVIDHSLHLEVRDYGSASHLFEAALEASAKGPIDSNKSQGMGIGLFLSHATINRHRGQISLETHKEGSCINITLPVERLEDLSH